MKTSIIILTTLILFALQISTAIEGPELLKWMLENGGGWGENLG